MRLLRRDLVATALVAVAGLVYLLWVVDAGVPALGSVRVVAAVVFVLGIAASVVAVVPTYVQLLRGDLTYLLCASALGVVALVASGLAVIGGSSGALAVLMATTFALWLASTVHHQLLLVAGPARVCPHCGRSIHETCEACAYEVVEDARDHELREDLPAPVA